jgi:hypothetical protein
MVWKETEFEEPHINNIIECVIEDTDEDCKIIHNSQFFSISFPCDEFQLIKE